MSRPTSVLVFGIINILLGILQVCGIAFWIISEMGLLPMPTVENPALDLMQSNAGYLWFSRISGVAGAVATVVILSAGIGLLTLQPWARLASIGWAIYSIVMSVLGTTLTYLLIFRPLLEQASGIELTVMKASLIGAAVMTFLMVGYCLLMIFMLTRPKVAAAFEDADEALATGVDGP